MGGCVSIRVSADPDSHLKQDVKNRGQSISSTNSTIPLRFSKEPRRPIFVSLYHLNEDFELIPSKVLKIALFAFLLPRRWIFMPGESWEQNTIFTANLNLKPALRRMIYEKDEDNMVLWVHPRFDRSTNDYKQGKSGWFDTNVKLGQIQDLTKNPKSISADEKKNYNWTGSKHVALNKIMEEEYFSETYQRFRDSWMYFLFKNKYLDGVAMSALKNNENPIEEKESTPIEENDADAAVGNKMTVEALEHNENEMSGTRHDSSPNVSIPSHLETEVIFKYVSSGKVICHGLNHIESLKTHTFMEILYHSNPTSVLPMISWNIHLWNSFHDIAIDFNSPTADNTVHFSSISTNNTNS